MDEENKASIAGQLQDLVLDSADVADFLAELAEFSATSAPGAGQLPIHCAITLYRRRKALTGAGSTAKARLLDEIQQRYKEGPCLHAMASGTTVVVRDVADDPRWRDYQQELLSEGIRSVLAVPLELDEGAKAAMNFFATVPDAFTTEVIERAEYYAGQAGKALRLAVRIGSWEQRADDLQEAMKSRTAIDLAVGVIMGQQRCTQEQAFAILARAASGRNQKVRDIAQDVLKGVSQAVVETHFDG
ncbi:ANTAR domain-containing protein [Pseudarthrobacter sp. P1]|uniref:ANTAR domain-containing protein n=1 Tax=Pseudarthrobacter sp. P1 TaxID=3418418 RepID=UPI003CF16B45